MTPYLETSREPLRPVVDSPSALDTCLQVLGSAVGPVAFDAERAHGHRYWPKAYLFQIRREGAGTWLIDPVALEDGGPAQLSGLVEACGDVTWLIHAASQDLPSMAEVGIRPPRLFDTELAGRLLGASSTGLAALLESKLEIRLRKAHSADNWATRPLPTSWLIYASLDVDYLIELAQVLHDELEQTKRLEWANQEFAHILQVFSTPPEPKPDPWRRLSGVTALKRPNQLAVARALWLERDAIARSKDRPPGRILPDTAIVDLAMRVPKDGPMPSADALTSVPGFRTRNAQRHRAHWVRALAVVADLDPSDYPPKRLPQVGIPSPRSWERAFPDAYQRWHNVRRDVNELACDLGLQASLLAPSTVLQPVVFNYKDGQDTADALRTLGARNWQVEFLTPLIEQACRLA